MQSILLSVVLALITMGSGMVAVASDGPRRTRTLSPELKEALIDALAGEDGEYAARAKYTAIVEKHGPVQPYAHLKTAENYHVLAMETYLKKHGFSPPTDRYAGKVIPPATLPEAAAEGIRIEERTIQLYERLLRVASDDPEFTRTLQNLQRMTREGHLASLKAAAESGGKLTADQIRARVWQRRSPTASSR